MKKVGAIIVGLLVFSFICLILPPLSKIIMGLIVMAFNLPSSPRFANNFEAIVQIGTIIIAALAGRQVYRLIAKPEINHKSFKISRQ